MNEHRVVVTDDNNCIWITIYPTGAPAPLAVVELTVEQTVRIAAELTTAAARHLSRERNHRVGVIRE